MCSRADTSVSVSVRLCYTSQDILVASKRIRRYSIVTCGVTLQSRLFYLLSSRSSEPRLRRTLAPANFGSGELWLRRTLAPANFGSGPGYITDSSNPLAQRLHLRRLAAALGITALAASLSRSHLAARLCFHASHRFSFCALLALRPPFWSSKKARWPS